MDRYTFVVLTNAKAGRDEEFNRWYDDVHIQDLLDIPGIVSADRYEASSAQHRGGEIEWGYLATYEIESDDVAGVLREIAERAGTERMPLSDAMDERRQAMLFRRR